MKDILRLIFSLCILVTGNYLYAQDIEWVAQFGGSSYDKGNSIAMDTLGNVYTVGYFRGTVDFDPSAGVHNLSALGNTSDIFIQKLDPSGNLIWVKSIGGNHADRGLSIAIDAVGDVYLTGFVRGAVDFDPGPGTTILPASNLVDYFVLKLNSNGDFLWAKSAAAPSSKRGNDLTIDQDNNVLITGYFHDTVDFSFGAAPLDLISNGSADVFIQKIDPSGHVIWAKSFGGTYLDYTFSITTDTLGNVYTTGYFNDTVDFDPGLGTAIDAGKDDIFIQKLDSAGNFLWVKTMKRASIGGVTNIGKSIVIDQGGNIYSTGFFSDTVDFDPGAGITNIPTQIQGKLYVQKLDPSGNLAWVKTLEDVPNSGERAEAIAVNELGDVYVTGHFYGTSDFDPGFGIHELTSNGSVNIFVLKLDASGNFLWTNSFGGPLPNSSIEGVDLLVAPTNHLYLTGEASSVVYWETDTLTSNGLSDAFVLKLKDFTSYIKGNVYYDTNLNCSKNIGEQEMGGFLIVATNTSSNLTYYGTTDAMGNYSIAVDTGNYTVNAVFSNPYWGACNNPSSLFVDSLYRNYALDFGLEALIACPMLQVDIAAPFLRNTSFGSFYSVSYCNNGTVDALNGRVEVEIDTLLQVLSTSIPIASQNGNIYTFDLDTIPFNTCDAFQIQVLADSSVTFDQTICSKVHIYPDSICIPNYWNGAVISPVAVCENDTVFFKLFNTGLAPFGAKDYYVFEDHIIMDVDNSGVINNGDSLVIAVAADTGKTYRIMIPQESGFPALLGDSIATIAIEGCVPDSMGMFSTNFMTQFSNGSSVPFTAIDCQPAIGSFDPNDKSAQPVGYGTQHYIEQYTALDFKIRFQNTGTDTAFNVVIRDTISDYLDIEHIQMGASSHPYSWRIYGQGILEITFSNIELPDSNVNELASHGFVRYRIEQKAGNPIGSIINNTASIYFDYNLPIVTNTTWHVVGQDFVPITIAIDKIYHSEIEVKVFPNPFKAQSQIFVGQHFEALEISVFDVMGRNVQTTKGRGNQLILRRDNLEEGLYFYRLEGDGKRITTGRIIIHN